LPCSSSPRPAWRALKLLGLPLGAKRAASATNVFVRWRVRTLCQLVYQLREGPLPSDQVPRFSVVWNSLSSQSMLSQNSPISRVRRAGPRASFVRCIGSVDDSRAEHPHDAGLGGTNSDMIVSQWIQIRLPLSITRLSFLSACPITGRHGHTFHEQRTEKEECT